MKKILCFRNSRLGDYLISIPSIRLIREQNKNCEIYYLSDELSFGRYLPKNVGTSKIVDEFIFYKKNFLSVLKLFFLLRTFNFQSLYYLQEKSNLYRELRDFIFFSLMNIKNKYGFFIKKKNYKKLSETIQLTHRVKHNTSDSKIYSLFKIKIKNEKKKFNFKYITISIGGFSQPKLWKKNHWSILLRILLNKIDHKILILGTSKDIFDANFLTSINKKRIISLCGKTNLDHLLNIVKFSETHITNDNGSMHIATLFQKKSICLFNNHDLIGKWNPHNKNAIILRNNFGVNEIKPIKVIKNLQRIFSF